MKTLPKGKITPEILCSMPGWKGSTVEGPMVHSFTWSGKGFFNDRGRWVEPGPHLAYKVTSKSGAVAWLLEEQPMREPFRIVIGDKDKNVLALGEADALSTAISKGRDLIKDNVAQKPHTIWIMHASIENKEHVKLGSVSISLRGNTKIKWFK